MQSGSMYYTGIVCSWLGHGNAQAVQVVNEVDWTGQGNGLLVDEEQSPKGQPGGSVMTLRKALAFVGACGLGIIAMTSCDLPLDAPGIPVLGAETGGQGGVTAPSTPAATSSEGGFLIFGQHTGSDQQGTPPPGGLAQGTPGATGASQPPIFADVPSSHWARAYIETLYHQGYVAGCATSPLEYCPDSPMTRGESAVLIEKGLHSPEYTPQPPRTQVLADVPMDAWYARWAYALWEEGFTAGCAANPPRFCPMEVHTRAEGAVLYMRLLRGADYIPPEPTTQIFTDVPPDEWYAKWVHAAHGEGLIPPCEYGKSMRFCPDEPLTRAVAAFMMVRAKGLPLPQEDQTAPAAIQDVTVSTVEGQAIMHWTAPGDDGMLGTAYGYDVRFSTQPLTQATWPTATELIGEPSPKPAGTLETVMIEGLEEHSVIYLAIKAVDEVGHEGALSNVAVRAP